jgi:O-antigen/teichoic acid export membrane protein
VHIGTIHVVSDYSITPMPATETTVAAVPIAPTGAVGDNGAHTFDLHTSARYILTVISQFGAMHLVVSLGGLIRNKTMAVYLKPSGFGEFTQLTSIATLLYLFVQFGMSVGLSRNTAAAGTIEERQRQLGTANFLTITLAVASLCLMIPVILAPVGSGPMAALGLQTGLQQKVLLVMLLSIAPIEALRNNYVSFLQGLIDVRSLSTRRSIAVLVSTAIAIPLVILFGALGACIQAALGTVLLAAVLGRRCRRLGYNPLSLQWDRCTMLTLAAFGTASLVSSLANGSGDTLIRAHLIAKSGLAANGIYQAAVALSTQVTGLILGSIGAYSLATLSQKSDGEKLTVRIESLFRVISPLALVCLGLVGLLAHPLFSLLFSSQFYDGTKFLPLLLCANYVQAAGWITGAPLLGSGLIRTWTIIQVAGAAIRYFTTMLTWSVVGVYAVPVGFLVAMIFDLAANIGVCRRLGIRASRRTAVCFLIGSVAVFAAATFGSFPFTLWTGLMGTVALFGTAAAIAGPDTRKLVPVLAARFSRPAFR